MMKKVISCCLLFAAIFTSCTNEEILLNEADTLNEVSSAIEAMAESPADNNTPEIDIVLNDNGTYNLLIDADSDGNILLNGSIKCLTCKESAEAEFGFAKKEGLKDLVITKISTPLEKEIVQLKLNYGNAKGEILNSLMYDYYIQENGNTSLQRPRPRRYKEKSGIVTIVVYESNGGDEMIINVDDDPAGQVSAVKVQFLNLPKNIDNGEYDCVITVTNTNDYKRRFNFNEELADYPFEVRLTFLDSDDNQIGEPFDGGVDISAATFAFIRRGKIKQKQTTGYRTILAIENGNADEIAYAEVKIEALNGNPSPKQPVYKFTSRKLDEGGRVRLMENGEIDFDADGDFDSRVAPGSSYQMTATLKNEKGQQIGPVYNETVVVEPPTNATTFAFIRRGKLKKKTTIGYRVTTVAKVSNPDEVAYAEVSLEPLNGSPETNTPVYTQELVDYDEETRVIKFSNSNVHFDGPTAVGDAYTMKATMKNLKGEPVGEPFVSTIEIEAAQAFGGKVKNVRIRVRRNSTQYRLSANGQVAPSTHPASVLLEIKSLDGISPKPLQDTYEIVLNNYNEENGNVSFTTADFAFEKLPTEGGTYQVVATMLNEKGESISEPFSETVEVAPFVSFAFIRRGKIKKKAVSSYRMVIVGKTSNPEDIEYAEISLLSLEKGPATEQLVYKIPVTNYNPETNVMQFVTDELSFKGDAECGASYQIKVSLKHKGDWACEDECLSESEIQVCGTTDHL